MIPLWNELFDNYIENVFIFANKFINKNDVIWIFHANDFWILKDIWFYFEEYFFNIYMKWVTVNTLHLYNNEININKVFESF
jgi:hypothetical protein